MSEKQIKKEATTRVVPIGDFISNIVVEFVKRIIRNGERLQYLMEEFNERFPKATTEEKYSLLSALQQMGIDCTPNDWIFFTPVEYRKSYLNSLVKNAKMYGSRHEDIMQAEEDVDMVIRETKKWLSDNEETRQRSPQQWTAKRQLLERLEICKKEMAVAKKIINSSLVYDVNYKGGNKALSIMNFAVSDHVYAILKSGESDIVQSPVADLSPNSAVSDAVKDDDMQTQTISLKKSFDNLKDDVALKPFYAKFKEMQHSDFDSPEVVEKNINALIETIDQMSELKTVTDQEKNDAYKAIKNFIDARKEEGIELKTEIDQYVDNSIQAGEAFPLDKENAGGGNDLTPKEQQGDFSPENTPGNVPPNTEPFTAKTFESMFDIKTAAATKNETEVATALKFIERISRILGEVQKSASIPKTVHVDQALRTLQASLSDIRNYVQSEWSYNSEAEKKAAIIILSNINKKLSSLIDLYTSMNGEEELMKYVVSSDFIRNLKTAQILLMTIGD